MSLHIRPILSALRRNRTGSVLVALQIAVALAVLVNATYIVQQRIAKITEPSGIDVDNIFVVMSQGFTKDYNHEDTMRQDLAWLRRVPGVIAATVSTHFPYSNSVWDNNLRLKPGDETNLIRADEYEVDHQALDALGLRLIAGRMFREDEIMPPLLGLRSEWVPSVIVTRTLARKMFGDTNALGKVIYDNQDRPATIIGILDKMPTGWVNWGYKEQATMIPRLATNGLGNNVYYMVRTQPGQRDNVMRQVEEHMSDSNTGRLIEYVRPLAFYKERSFRDDRNMSIFLTTVTVLLLAITSLGIYGLATYNVSTRTRQIGTRRALGARRLDIVRYFMVENWLITTSGVVIGGVLTLAVGHWLSREYDLPRLDLYYLLGGVVALWLIGQLAAWQPARRAATISPAVATRTM